MTELLRLQPTREVFLVQDQAFTEDDEETLARRQNELQRLWDDSDMQKGRAAIRGKIERARGQNLTSLETAWARMPDEPAFHALAKIKMAPNVIGDALDLFSYLYNTEPVRTMKGGKTSAKWARNVLWDYEDGLTATLDEADWYVRLLGQVLLYEQFVSDKGPHADEDTSSGIALTYLTPDRYLFLSNTDRPDIIDAVWILVSERMVASQTSSNGDPNDHGAVIQRFHYWDDTHHTEWDRRVPFTTNDTLSTSANWLAVDLSADPSVTTLVQKHGYGVVPVVWLPNEIPPAGYAPIGMGGADLLRHSVEVGRLVTEYLFTAALSRGQPYIKGGSQRDEKTTGTLAPDSIIDTDGDFGIAASGADLGGMKDALNTALYLFAISVGLPPDTWRIDGPSIETGVSVYARRVRIVEDRKKRTRLAFSKWEKPTHVIAAKIWQKHTGETIDGRVESVEYAITPPVLTAEQRLQQAAFELDKALAGRAEIKRDLHPSLSPEEVAKRLLLAEEDAAKATPETVVAGRDLDNGEAATLEFDVTDDESTLEVMSGSERIDDDTDDD